MTGVAVLNEVMGGVSGMFATAARVSRLPLTSQKRQARRAGAECKRNPLVRFSPARVHFQRCALPLNSSAYPTIEKIDMKSW